MMHGKNQRGGKRGCKQTGPHSLCHLALTLMETKQLHTKESVTQRTKESAKQCGLLSYFTLSVALYVFYVSFSNLQWAA